MGLTPPTETDPSRFSEVLITHPSYVKAIRDLFNALWKQAIPLASRFAMLQGRRLLPSQTRVIQGREELYAQLPAEWRRKTRKTIANMTTRYGPVRILHGARETFWEASRRGVKLQLVCDVCRENVSAVRELATIAEIRHNNLPLSVSIGILDQSEALIHYVQPDTPDLTSPTDVAIVTTNRNSIHDLRCLFDLVWDHSIPFERRLQELSRTQKAVAGITRRPTWARSRHVH